MRSIALALLLLALAPAAATAGAMRADDVTLGPIALETPLAAYGGRLAWSERRADGRWRLVTSHRPSYGVPTPVDVPDRGAPFDVDLGPAPDGHVVAVYSRCDRETAADPRGCDLYHYDFTSQRETRVASASSPTASETDPTVWRDRIAFQRRYDRKRAYPYLYVRPLARGGASRRVPAGQRRECRRTNGRTTCTDERRSGAQGLELHGRWLAFTWRYAAFAEGPAADLRLSTVTGDRRLVVERLGRGGLTQVEPEFPGFDAGRLYWIRTCAGDPQGCAGRVGQRRTAVTGGAVTGVRWPGDARAFDRQAGEGFLISGRCEYPPPDGAPCRLRFVDPVFPEA